MKTRQSTPVERHFVKMEAVNDDAFLRDDCIPQSPREKGDGANAGQLTQRRSQVAKTNKSEAPKSNP